MSSATKDDKYQSLERIIIENLLGRYVVNHQNEIVQVTDVHQVENNTGFNGCPVTTFRLFLESNSYEPYIDVGLEDWVVLVRE